MTQYGLEVKRTLDASPEQVFEAWIRPGELKKWWCTPGHSFESMSLDAKPAGTYRFELLNEVGEPACTMEGEFLEVVHPEKLVYTWTMDVPAMNVCEAGTTVTVLLKPAGSQTELTLRHEGFQNKMMYELHDLDWPIVLDNLVALMKSRETAR